ncbi:serine hydrolase [Emticicia sp. 21SJ11W-3]|uniref:serine hydrolase n=1 Tax=Emticicia sp. 21SJ11W-3 TaxID=2916755 RepID=UPI0020A09DD5|nr:serine hydrolase [Emticicia sp. 21SJ11W-3]UTA70010.1 class A beta-lactamase-related serine hydrolase [Emticicia sp. 21SJ11W-3]
MKNLRTYFILTLCLIAYVSSATAQTLKEDKKLKAQLQEILNGFNGDAGIYVQNLKTNKYVAINADTVFPTASMVKIPIMIGTFDKIRQGSLQYEQELIYRDSLHYDDGIVGSLRDSAKIPLSHVMMLMCTISDNTGSLWLQALAGGGKRINAILDSLGFVVTRVNSRTPGREAYRSQYGWGQTSPREMAKLLTLLRRGEIISPAYSDRMYRNLGRQFWDSHGLSQIPENVKVATKNGAVNRSRSETVLVHAPGGEYVYSIITKNQKDESWTRTNEGFELLRKVSALLWHYYEPKSKWKPVDGYDKF